MIRLLAILLVLQLAVLAFLYLPSEQPVETPSSLMPGVDRSLIDRVEIADGSGTTLSLQRDSDGWHLPSGLAIDERKLDTLLEALFDQRLGLAIATSDSAASRFSVAPEKFERRIAVTVGDQEQVVFLGDAPAFRKVYARRDNDAAIYTINLNSFDAPFAESEWLDQTLLARGSVLALTVYGSTLTLVDGTWSNADASPLNLGGVETLIQILASLRVNGIAETGDPAFADATEALRIGVADGSGNAELAVLRTEDSEDEPARFFLQDSRYAMSFETSAYDAERLIEAVASIFPVEDPTFPVEDPTGEPPAQTSAQSP